MAAMHLPALAASARRFALSLALCLVSAAHAAAIHVRVIGINDFHGNLQPEGLSLTVTDPAGLAEQLEQRPTYVLDVRQPAEWRHGHIHGSHNVPLMHLKSRLDTIPHDTTIVTVCASGHRSNVAARTLQR